MEFDPFDVWKAQGDAPNEEEERSKAMGGFDQVQNEDGSYSIVVTPTPAARISAAELAGIFIALQETNAFSREEAFALLCKSVSAMVVVHVGEDDDDDDE